MKVSVIATVLNEGPAIRRLLDSLVAQTNQVLERSTERLIEERPCDSPSWR